MPLVANKDTNRAPIINAKIHTMITLLLILILR
jgi:hypothetical protein